MPLTLGGTVLIDERNRFFDELFGEFLGISNGCRGENKLRLGSVEAGDAFQAPDDIGDMRTKDTAIHMHLIYDHEAQGPEEIFPSGVVREDTGVEHVGIGHNDLGLFADQLTCMRRRIAIIDIRGNAVVLIKDICQLPEIC